MGAVLSERGYAASARPMYVLLKLVSPKGTEKSVQTMGKDSSSDGMVLRLGIAPYRTI